VFLWDNSGNDLFRLRFSQKGKEVVFFVSGSNKVSPPPQAFEYFEEGTGARGNMGQSNG
jgi:hypothetical protein